MVINNIYTLAIHYDRWVFRFKGKNTNSISIEGLLYFHDQRKTGNFKKDNMASWYYADEKHYREPTEEEIQWFESCEEAKKYIPFKKLKLKPTTYEIY